MLDIERRALSWILPISESLLSVQRHDIAIRKFLRPLACKPGCDRAVVRSGMREDFFGEQSSQIEVVIVCFECCENAGIVRRIYDHCHRLEVFGGRAKHRRPADIDVLDYFVFGDSCSRSRCLEWVEV